MVLKPGEKQVFTVTVENSFFPDQIEVLEAAGQTRINLGTGGTHTIDYTAPKIEELPESLVVHHTTQTGARRFDNTARSDFSRIRARPVVILQPLESCLDPGKETDILVTVQGTEDEGVTWSLERLAGSGPDKGKITSGGHFTAPNSPGVIEVTATSVVDSEARGSVVIKVGGCDCWWFVSIEGRTFFGMPGQDKGSFTLEPQIGLLAISLDRLTGGSLLALSAEPVPVIPGAYPFALFAGSIGLTAPDVSYSTQEPPTITGVLSEFTSTLLKGSISGPIVILTPNPDDLNMPVIERPSQISIRFSILADPQFPLAPQCFVE